MDQSQMWANRGDGGLYIVILCLIWFVTLKLLAFELSNSLFFTGTKPTPRQRRFQWIIVYNVWQHGTGDLWRETAGTPKGVSGLF